MACRDRSDVRVSTVGAARWLECGVQDAFVGIRRVGDVAGSGLRAGVHLVLCIDVGAHGGERINEVRVVSRCHQMSDSQPGLRWGGDRAPLVKADGNEGKCKGEKVPAGCVWVHACVEW